VETTARTSLRQTLYALRKTLRGADPPPLRQEAATVALDPAAVTVDVDAFVQRTAETTPSALADAIALYEGDFLEGLTVQEPPFEDWLLRERERLREVALHALARLLTHQRAAGSIEAAIQTALRLLTLDPLQESVHRSLMQLYAETGRQGAALRQYQLCVATLQRELRTEPETETKALATRKSPSAPSRRSTGTSGPCCAAGAATGITTTCSSRSSGPPRPAVSSRPHEHGASLQILAQSAFFMRCR
jgi:DNA-binding SARP family transcriptional activator